MTDLNPEELLWKLSATDRDDWDAALPPDETLLAYREGRLKASEAERLETLLAQSSAARDRLIELAEITLAAPSAALRERLVPQPPHRWWAAGAAVAAGLLLALGLYWIQPREPRDVPSFDVSVELLAEVRSSPSPSIETVPGTTHQAFAETPVRIVVQPTRNAVAGVEFGLYIRRDEGLESRLEHLAPGAGLDLETHRGTAVFEATAARLVGATPGVYELFVVAANKLPETVALTSGAKAQTSLEAVTDGRIYRREITLLPGPQ